MVVSMVCCQGLLQTGLVNNQPWPTLYDATMSVMQHNTSEHTPSETTEMINGWQQQSGYISIIDNQKSQKNKCPVYVCY